jgi:alcohol dehydrogenase (cytochrome c)
MSNLHRPSSRVWSLAGAAVLFVLGLLRTRAGSDALPQGFYTQAQASSGQTVYTQHCAQCHGTNLQGQSGSSLVGSQFQQHYASGTMAELYDFISKQMPANAPGSLRQEEYLAVTAFILAKNGAAAGATPLSASSLGTRLTGVMGHATGGATGASRISAEIVRSTPPTHRVWARVRASVAVSDAMMRGAEAARSDWLLHGRTYANDRYSPLAQIDTGNVRSLTPVAIVQTGMMAPFETTPVVVHGVMYLTTGVVNNQMKIIAVDASTGKGIWDATYTLGPFQLCCGPVNRGVAIGYGKVYAVTLDDKLVALDARNGSPVFSTTIADARLGYSETMAPQIYDGMVLVGSAGGEWPIRGFVAAYDARTGKQRWRWSATDPKAYTGDSWKRGGAMVWTTPAIDAQRNLVIFSTGNPNPDLDGKVRKGDNRYSDSIVALDARSGKLRWSYQEVKHDLWDYDAASNVVLFDVHVNGRTIPVAGEAGKVGWFFIVDRRNGKLIRKSAPFVMMSKNMFATPTKTGVKILPGANGGAEWSPPAYSPRTHLVYVPAMNQLMTFTTQPTRPVAGQVRLGSTLSNVAKGGIQNGPFVAIDTETGRIAWRYIASQPLVGGALVTAGNLAFVGEGNGAFDAFDARRGKLLWQFQLGAGVNAPPVSYAVNGRQYIAVAAGGNFQFLYSYGDTVTIFALGSRR